MKSGSYLRRQLLPISDSSTSIKKDSKVENLNKKHLGKILQDTGRRATSQIY